MNTINNNTELQKTINEWLKRQELWFQAGVSAVTLWGMILLPLIPASLSFSAIVSKFPELLHIPVWLAYVVAAFTGAGIEFLGLSSVKLALRMRKYNAHAPEGMEKAPIGQGATIAGIYLVTVVALTILLKVFPALAIWSLLPLAGMGALADWLIALQNDHNEREAAFLAWQEAQEAERNQASKIERLQSALADRDSQLAGMSESVKSAEQRNATMSEEFNSERQTLNTEIVKLNAQLDALRAIQLTHSSARTVENDTTDNASVPDINTVRQLALDGKRNARAQRQQDLLRILLTEFNGQPSDTLNKSEIAQRLGTTRQTIGKDIEELTAAQKLNINGHVNVLI